MLPDSPEVKEVVLGEGGVIQGVKPGAVVIDMSSINPLVTQEIARTLDVKGVKMLDAPVSGGETGAIQGTLAIMVGGEKKVFEDCQEILKAMGKNIVHVGGIGAGGYVKLVNQIIVALNIASVGEAFCLGVKGWTRSPGDLPSHQRRIGRKPGPGDKGTDDLPKKFQARF
jgi:3-hydroxyisobutyrate dehydrogenase-like beta-hydroxyacid dehydrogenase